MDLTVIRKKISSYRTPTGQIRNLPDELLGEILHAWEQWTGTGKSFYKELNSNQKKMASIIGKAKKLKREGYFPEDAFTEIKIEQDNVVAISEGCNSAEVVWNDGKIIRFNDINLLVDFLKKVA